MKIMKTLNLISCALFALLLMSACTQNQTITTPVSQKFTFGALLPLSGDAAAYGTEFQKVINIALEEINANGGVNGKPLEVIYEDGKCNPKDGSTAAQKLVEVDKVSVILGGGCSGETLGAAPITEQNKVLLISPSASSPDITNAGDYVFRTNPSDAYAGKVAAEYASKMGFKKAAIIYETTDYAQGIKRVFDGAFKGADRTVVATESYATEEADFKTQLTKIKESNPDVIYVVTQTPNKLSRILTQMDELGIRQQIFVDAIMIRGILKDGAPKNSEGLIGVEPKFDQNSGKAKNLFQKFRAKYGNETFGFYDAATYDTVHLIADGLAKHGNNAEEIKNDWYNLKYQGAIGELTFDKNGDLITQFSIEQVKSGQIVEIGVAS